MKSEEVMASNKLTKMVTKNTQKLISILAYAFVEWVVILLLLINSCLFYLIRRFAAYFGLKPPCPWCSRLGHPYETLLCEHHAKEISSLTYCSSHGILAESKGICEQCFCSYDTNCRCTCCGKVLGTKENDCEHQIMSDVGSFGVRDAADEDSHEEDDEVNNVIRARDSLVETTEMELGMYPVMPDVTTVSAESKDIEAEGDGDGSVTIQQLKSDLEAEIKARNEMYVELEAERSAAAIAANQTMAMITRLQEEKASMQMEALQYQRVMEEQAEYDQQALQLLNELMVKREIEKQDLEKELDNYHLRVSDYEARDNSLVMLQKCAHISSDSDSDSDVLSIDLNRGYEKPEDEVRKDISLMDSSKEWGAIEDSLEELEEERVSIMKQLKELEQKLVDDHQTPNPNAELESCCFVDQKQNQQQQPKTMASVARSLLDLVVSSESETEDHSGEIGFDENGNKRVAVEKEMDHLYRRLQALEADTEFLRHCIGSVSKGNQGALVLQEILEHLRELRAAEICF